MSTAETVPLVAPKVMSSQDRTDIVMALREIATGIEQQPEKMLELMFTVGCELLVLALKYRPDDDGPDAAATEIMVRREIEAIGDTILRYHRHQITERHVLNERLMRMFDPTVAFAEAVNRAIDAKTKAGEAIMLMTPQEKFRFDTLTVPGAMRRFQDA